MKTICTICGLMAGLMASAAPAREWTDRTGKFHIEASFVTVKEGKVYLEKEGGKVISVPLEKLSAQSLDYLQSLPETKDYFDEHPLKSDAAEMRSKLAEVIHVGDPKKMGEIRRLHKTGWSVESLAFSPDGRFLVAGRADNAIEVFDVDNGAEVDQKEHLDGLGQVTCLAFAPSGRTLLSGGLSGRIQLWKLARNGQLSEAKRFSGHSARITAIDVSRDGKSVLSGDEAKRVRFWSLDTCREQFACEGFQHNILVCFLSRTAKQGLAGDGAKIDLIDTQKGESIQSMPLARGLNRICAISRNGRYVACDEMNGLRVWEIRTGKEMPECQEKGMPWSAAFTIDGKHLLFGGNSKVNLWEVATGRKLYEFDTDANAFVKSIVLSPDGKDFSVISTNPFSDVVVYRLPLEVQSQVPAAD